MNKKQAVGMLLDLEENLRSQLSKLFVAYQNAEYGTEERAALREAFDLMNNNIKSIGKLSGRLVNMNDDPWTLFKGGDKNEKD